VAGEVRGIPGAGSVEDNSNQGANITIAARMRRLINFRSGTPLNHWMALLNVYGRA